jgi:hypothetical protein
MMKLILTLGCLGLGFGSKCIAVTVGASYDADTYYFTQTYNEVRTGALNTGTFHVGQHILNTNPTYNGHFNFGAVLFQDLSSLSLGSGKYLQLNVRDFKTPVAVDPSYQGPPLYSYLTTGNFRLAVVALSADFSETAVTADLPGWYQTHLYSRPRVAELDIANAGIFQVDVTGAVDNWISTPSTNFGFGLIGLDSTPTASTLRFYSMEATNGLGPALIPEPGTGSLLLAGLASVLSLRRRFRA